MPRLYRSFLFLFLLPSVVSTAQSQPQSRISNSAENVLREYVEARLRWADWKEYSRFITWPDEAGWDCWWVATDYRIGKTVRNGANTIIPVTYRRLGLFCNDFQLQRNPKVEKVNYELVRNGWSWKINGPIPDYPYISVRALDGYLRKEILDPSETTERKTQARRALEALRIAKRP
jgi:hypothetical protein